MIGPRLFIGVDLGDPGDLLLELFRCPGESHSIQTLLVGEEIACTIRVVDLEEQSIVRIEFVGEPSHAQGILLVSDLTKPQVALCLQSLDSSHKPVELSLRDIDEY